MKMRELKNVKYTHTSELSDTDRKEMIIPQKYHGTVAIETWNINGKLKMRYVCVPNVTNYLLGLGDFKPAEVLEEDNGR